MKEGKLSLIAENRLNNSNVREYAQESRIVDQREHPEYEVDRRTYYKDNAQISYNPLP